MTIIRLWKKWAAKWIKYKYYKVFYGKVSLSCVTAMACKFYKPAWEVSNHCSGESKRGQDQRVISIGEQSKLQLPVACPCSCLFSFAKIDSLTTADRDPRKPGWKKSQAQEKQEIGSLNLPRYMIATVLCFIKLQECSIVKNQMLHWGILSQVAQGDRRKDERQEMATLY